MVRITLVSLHLTHRTGGFCGWYGRYASALMIAVCHLHHPLKFVLQNATCRSVARSEVPPARPSPPSWGARPGGRLWGRAGCQCGMPPASRHAGGGTGV